MKVKNETDYPTRALRAVLCEVYRRTRQTEGALPQWASVRFRIAYTRRCETSGWAHVNGTLSRLRIARGGLDPAAFAQLADHELLHLYGFHHAGMPCSNSALYYAPEARERFSWARDMVGDFLVETAPAVGPTLDVRREKRMEQTAAAIDRWTRKLKRAENALRKLRAKERRLRSVLALAASPKEAR